VQFVQAKHLVRLYNRQRLLPFHVPSISSWLQRAAALVGPVAVRRRAGMPYAGAWCPSDTLDL